MKTSEKLILITQRKTPLPEYLDFICRCAEAGVTSVQLREKAATPGFLEDFGFALRETLAPFHIPLVVNDDVTLATRLDAAGVHLGQGDGNITETREKLGAHKIIGVSVETWRDIDIANASCVSYVSASAVFPTKNKSDIKTIWGLDGLARLAGKSKHPVVAIGGITLENAQAVLQAGAKGLAVIGAVHDAEDPAATVKALRRVIDAACRERYLHAG